MANPGWQEYARHHNTGATDMTTSPEYDAYLVKMFPPGVHSVTEWDNHVKALMKKATSYPGNTGKANPYWNNARKELQRFQASVTNYQVGGASYGESGYDQNGNPTVIGLAPKGWKGGAKPASNLLPNGEQTGAAGRLWAFRKRTGRDMTPAEIRADIKAHPPSKFKPLYSPGEEGRLSDQPLWQQEFSKGHLGKTNPYNLPMPKWTEPSWHADWKLKSSNAARAKLGLSPLSSDYYSSSSKSDNVAKFVGTNNPFKPPKGVFNLKKGQKLENMTAAEKAQAEEKYKKWWYKKVYPTKIGSTPANSYSSSTNAALDRARQSAAAEAAKYGVMSSTRSSGRGYTPASAPQQASGRGASPSYPTQQTGGRSSASIPQLTPVASPPATPSGRSSAPQAAAPSGRSSRGGSSGHPYYYNSDPWIRLMGEDYYTHKPRTQPPDIMGQGEAGYWHGIDQKMASIRHFFDHYGLSTDTASPEDWDSYYMGKIPPNASKNTPPGWSQGTSGTSADGSSTGNQAAMNDLSANYWEAYKQARSANENRYNQILREYGSLEQASLAGLDVYGNREREELNTRYDNLGTQTQQGLVDAGLSGTTVAPTMRAGIEDDRSTQLRNMDDELARLKTDYRGQLAGQRLGFMERREDTYPDLNQLIALGQGTGASGPAYNPWTGANSQGYVSVQPSKQWQSHTW